MGKEEGTAAISEKGDKNILLNFSNSCRKVEKKGAPHGKAVDGNRGGCWNRPSHCWTKTEDSHEETKGSCAIVGKWGGVL